MKQGESDVEWFKDNFMKANAPKFQVAFISREMYNYQLRKCSITQ